MFTRDDLVEWMRPVWDRFRADYDAWLDATRGPRSVQVTEGDRVELVGAGGCRTRHRVALGRAPGGAPRLYLSPTPEPDRPPVPVDPPRRVLGIDPAGASGVFQVMPVSPRFLENVRQAEPFGGSNYFRQRYGRWTERGTVPPQFSTLAEMDAELSQPWRPRLQVQVRRGDPCRQQAAVDARMAAEVTRARWRRERERRDGTIRVSMPGLPGAGAAMETMIGGRPVHLYGEQDVEVRDISPPWLRGLGLMPGEQVIRRRPETS